MYQLVETVVALPEGRDPDADADFDPVAVCCRDLAVGDGASQALGNDPRVLGVGVGQQGDELITTEAYQRVGLSKRAHSASGDRLQHLVPGFVPERVVDLLEEVDVEDQEGERLPVRARFVHHIWCRLDQVAAIEEAGEDVDGCEVTLAIDAGFELADQRVQLVPGAVDALQVGQQIRAVIPELLFHHLGVSEDRGQHRPRLTSNVSDELPLGSWGRGRGPRHSSSGATVDTIAQLGSVCPLSDEMPTSTAITLEAGRYYVGMRRFCHSVGWALWIGIGACDVDPDQSHSRPATVPGQPGVEPESSNFLLIVSDDQGVDWVNAYDAFVEEPRTPNLDGLASEGLLFRRAYASPTCSPGRATLLTGRFGFRYGIGMAIRGDELYELPESETILPAVLAPSYSSALVGKWHLGTVGLSGYDQPLEMGFGSYTGTIGSLSNYYNWQRVEAGESSWVQEYATVVTADAAIDAIETLQEPWFVMVTFNAPHAPFHEPPEDLHSYELGPGSSDTTRFAAAVEALDTELGRILDALSEEQRQDTYVMYLSDNGTMHEVLQPAEGYGGKNSVRETGVRVPLVIRGPGVAIGETDAMVQTVDFLPTIAEIAGIDVPSELEIDGRSFASVLEDPSLSGRDLVYSERFVPNGFGPYDLHRQGIRNERFKLIRSHDQGADDLYDLQGRIREGDPLPQPYSGAALAAWEDLVTAMEALDAPM